MNYGLIRFSLEYLRGDVDYIIKGPSPLLSFTVFQAVSLLMILGGLFFYNRQRKNVPS
jgi:prolipoprotein diacylglyceryltransferase